MRLTQQAWQLKHDTNLTTNITTHPTDTDSYIHILTQKSTSYFRYKFPVLQSSADILSKDIPLHPSPMSLSAETSEHQFLPNFDNGTTDLPFSNVLPTEQQSVKLHFVEDEAIGSPISEPCAKYVEDCCR